MALRDTHVTLAHGGGGRAMRDLIDEVFTSVFLPPGSEDQARLMHAALQEPGAQLAFTTDSFVVTPVEFPGGDIGKIAVCGTINDLAVGGARPLWLSAAGFLLSGLATMNAPPTTPAATSNAMASVWPRRDEGGGVLFMDGPGSGRKGKKA